MGFGGAGQQHDQLCAKALANRNQLGETFPLRVRPKAIALGSATNWFWNFMLSYFSE